MRQEDLQLLIDRLENNSSFEHAGVKGMKWGVRNKRKTNSTSDGSGAKAGRGGGSKVKVRVVKKKVKDMSNAELQARVNRLNLEKQYRQLNPSKGDRVKKMLIKAGEEVVTKYTKAYIDDRVGKMLPDLAKAANSKKDKGAK